jgi:hypothetical protein
VNEVDWYDVESAKAEAERNARSYTDASVSSLRREIADLQDAIESLKRTLESRTGHLV